jgi:hypothetical protein
MPFDAVHMTLLNICSALTKVVDVLVCLEGAGVVVARCVGLEGKQRLDSFKTPV